VNNRHFGCVLFQIYIDLDLSDEIIESGEKERADLSGPSGRGHLILVCTERHRPRPLLLVNKLHRRPAAQMGVAKSDFCQMHRSRSDLIENAERFARIDLDRSIFEKERNHCIGLSLFVCLCSERDELASELARLNVHVQQLVAREADAYQQVKACVELAEQSQMDMAQVSICLSARLSVCHMSVCLSISRPRGRRVSTSEGVC